MNGGHGVALLRLVISVLSLIPAYQHPALYRRTASRAGRDMNLPFIRGDVFIWHDMSMNRDTEQAVNGLF
jgi:hypothetical protein